MANRTVNDLLQWAIINVLPPAGEESGLIKVIAKTAAKFLISKSVLETSLPDKVNEVFVKIETDGMQKIVENILNLIEQQLQNVDLNNLTGGQEVLTEAK